MEPQIKKLSGFKIIGKELITTTDDGKNFKEIPAFWGREMENKLLEKIPNTKSEETFQGISID